MHRYLAQGIPLGPSLPLPHALPSPRLKARRPFWVTGLQLTTLHLAFVLVPPTLAVQCLVTDTAGSRVGQLTPCLALVERCVPAPFRVVLSCQGDGHGQRTGPLCAASTRGRHAHRSACQCRCEDKA